MMRSLSSINFTVPQRILERLVWLPDSAQSMSTAFTAGKGAGKSKFLGRAWLWQNLIRGTATVVYDPVGGTIDQLLSKIAEFPKDVQAKLWPRVMYIDMAGTSGYVVPFPIVYHLPGEPLAAAANRYIDTIRRTDSALAGASIEGLNALSRVAIPTIMLLAALEEPITRALSLLDSPQLWEPRFAEAVSRYPEALSAAAFFNEYMGWNAQERARSTLSFRAKLGAFSYNPMVQALYGGSTAYRLDLTEVVEKRLIVLLDFRHIYAEDERRFALLWTLQGLLDWVRRRGPGHHHPPLSIVIDELAAMLNVDPAAANLMTADIDALLNQLARNYNLRPVLAYQAPSQFDPKVQRALFGCGTQIVGAVANIDDAITLARNLFTLSMQHVKRYEPIYASNRGVTDVIDYRSIDYTVEEELLLQAYKIKNQLPFHFLARIARREGDTTAPVRRISIANLDPGRYADEQVAARARYILSKRSGVPVAKLLSEIDAPRASRSATMKGYAPTTQISNHDPVSLPATYCEEGYEESYDDYYPDKK